jgi:hypothetical protein
MSKAKVVTTSEIDIPNQMFAVVFGDNLDQIVAIFTYQGPRFEMG